MHVSFDENFKNFEDTNDEEDLITQNQETTETNNEINHHNKKIKLLKESYRKYTRRYAICCYN